MDAKHENGSIIQVARKYDLRTLKLLADCGYTHVRTPSWDWQPIATAIASATPSSAWLMPGGIGGMYPAFPAVQS